MRDASTQHVAGVASAVGVERRRLARAERVHTLRIRRYLDLLGDKTEAGVGDGDQQGREYATTLGILFVCSSAAVASCSATVSAEALPRLPAGGWHCAHQRDAPNLAL